MSLSPQTPNFSQLSSTARSFWDRREGGFAKWVLIAAGLAIAAGVVFAWGVILPFLIGVVGNTIQLAALCGVVAVLASPLYSKTVRLFLSNAFQLTMRWGYQKLIAKDPIGMLRNNVAQLAAEAKEFDGGVSQLAGSKQRLESDIQTQMDSVSHDKSMRDAATRKIVQMQAKLESLINTNDKQQMQLDIQGLQLAIQGYEATAGIALQTIKAEQPILDQTNRMYEQICRLRQLAQFKVQSLTQQADMYSKQRSMILASQRALGAAGRILKGDPQQLAIVDQTIEYLNNETADTIGAMKDFNRDSEKYLTNMDIEKDAQGSEAQKVFSQLEQKLSLPDILAGNQAGPQLAQGALAAGTVSRQDN